MQAPGDNIIYQLTNIGASPPQPPPQQRSPIRTPKTSSAGSTPSRDGLTTISPSRGRRWADKLAKFQKYTDKKKSNSSSENGRISTSPVVPQTLPLVVNSHGSRTSSLPRPPEMLELGGLTLAPPPPPKLGRFGHNRPSISSKKSFLNEYCTVCDEPVFNRGSGERIIELECNHISHEECLLVSFENESNGYNPADFFSIFPPCNRCYSSKKVENRCVPKNDELKDKLISVFLINGHTRARNLESITSSSPTVPLLPLLVPNDLSPSAKRPSPLQVTPSPHSDTLKKYDSKTNDIRPDSIPATIKNKRTQEIQHERPISQSISRYSPLRSSIVSKRKTGNYSVSSSDKLTLYVLRAHFIEILIKNFTTLSGWQIDEQFGLLRIVDRLMVSRNGIDYRGCWCMLFEKALLVAPLAKEASVNEDASSDTFLQEFNIYKPLTSVIVDIVESSVLKWTFPTNDSSPWREVYVTETLNTDASQVVQKWTTAILDLELEFSEKYFTSTLPPPLIMRNEIKSSHLSSSLMGMVTSTKLVELASDRRSSLVVRRGFKLSEDQGASLSATGTIESVMTSVSSILSLKREKPDELIVVLQIDFNKIQSENKTLVIFNSLKALGLKFPDMKLCIVDMEGFIKVHGKARDLVTTAQDLASVQKSPRIRFEPIQLKNLLYPGAILKNLGIAIVSNTAMDEQKSCLLKDYSCFTCEGRRRPREIKVKVGYLNLDYSDKIGELVELGSWDDFLEALSYSFGLAFGDDDDDDISTMDEAITDSENDQLIEDDHSMSSNGSTTTILIASPFKENENNPGSLFSNNEVDDVGAMCNPSSSVPSMNVYSREHASQSTSNKLIRDECDFLLRDIERAIREIDEISSPSPTDTNSHPSSHPSTVYQYI